MSDESHIIQCIRNGFRRRIEESTDWRNRRRKGKDIVTNVCRRRSSTGGQGARCEGDDKQIQKILGEEESVTERRKIKGVGIRERKR